MGLPECSKQSMSLKLNSDALDLIRLGQLRGEDSYHVFETSGLVSVLV
jgi:hypothetical protein